MGYDTTLHGKLVSSQKVSPDFLNWFNNWQEIRHSIFSEESIKEGDPKWQLHTPHGALGKNGVLYAPGKQVPRNFIRDDNHPNQMLGDYYFPFVVTPECMDEDENGKHLFELVPSGGEKPYEVEKGIKFFVKCDDINQDTGYMSGVILGIGEEFGDAWYILVNDGAVKQVMAYADNAESISRDFLSGNDKALSIFEEVYQSPMQLEYYWDED